MFQVMRTRTICWILDNLLKWEHHAGLKKLSRWITKTRHSNNSFADLLLLVFTHYKTIRGLPQSAVLPSRCITCQDVSVQQSHAALHSVISNKPRLHLKSPCSYNNLNLDKQKGNLDDSDGKYTELRMSLSIVENELHSAFPNTQIALHVYLCLMVSNCTGESFSKMRRSNNYFRSSIWQGKLSMLSQMSMEHEILGDTDLETIINDFACNKCGVMKLFVADLFSKSTHSQSDSDQG